MKAFTNSAASFLETPNSSAKLAIRVVLVISTNKHEIKSTSYDDYIRIILDNFKLFDTKIKHFGMNIFHIKCKL